MTLAGVPGQVTTPLVPYGQGHARGLTARELGLHGEQMDSLVRLGLPTVAGVTVPVAHAAELTDAAVAATAVELLEQLAQRRVEDVVRPVLFRLVASAPVRATGLPPSVTGLGLDPHHLDDLARVVGRADDLVAAWAVTVQLVAEEALHVPGDVLDDIVMDVPDPAGRVTAMLAACAEHGDRAYPEDAADQVALAATALLARWESPRGQRARRAQSLPADLGLASHLPAVRIGPWELSGHGTAVSRDLQTGAFDPHGRFVRGVSRDAAGPDDGEPLSAVPGGIDVLREALRTLESHFHDVVEVGFEVRDGRLALLSARPVDRPTARAAVRLASDLASAGTIDRALAVTSLRPELVQELLHAQLRLTGGEAVFVRGLPASPGAASGRIALSSATALEMATAGVPTVLVTSETTPADVPALLAAEAVLTSNGGLASHAAVVARTAGRPAVCGATALRIDLAARTVTNGDVVLNEGDPVSLDGRTGAVYTGVIEVRSAEPSEELDRLLAWADDHRRLAVRANADTARETLTAIRLGAEGIGLCRTEHQFLGDRLPLVRRFVLAEDEESQADALTALSAAQREDFRELLRAVGDRPVTVRLLDAPVHEFLPHDGEYENEQQARRAADLHETNPMLGLRGVRLALMHEHLYPAQAEALFSAYVDVLADGIRPQLEVMIPLVSLPQELAVAVAQVHEAAVAVAERTGVTVPYLVGSMIETPRAALLADRLAEHAEFLSFGTNDLTQLTYGFSRDDVEKTLLQRYLERGLLAVSPFAALDQDGVGALIEIAVTRARAVRPTIKLGLCGEQGGDPASIALVDRLGLHYVSCSPQRVPVARLASAHATLGVN